MNRRHVAKLTETPWRREHYSTFTSRRTASFSIFEKVPANGATEVSVAKIAYAAPPHVTILNTTAAEAREAQESREEEGPVHGGADRRDPRGLQFVRYGWIRRHRLQ